MTGLELSVRGAVVACAAVPFNLAGHWIPGFVYCGFALTAIGFTASLYSWRLTKRDAAARHALWRLVDEPALRARLGQLR